MRAVTVSLSGLSIHSPHGSFLMNTDPRLISRSPYSLGTAVTRRALNRYNAWAAIRRRAKAAGFIPRRMSHREGNVFSRGNAAIDSGPLLLI